MPVVVSVLVIPQGSTTFPVTVDGLGTGSTTVFVSSARGDGGVIATVSPQVEGKEYPLFGVGPGVVVQEPPLVATIFLHDLSTVSVRVPILDQPAPSSQVLPVVNSGLVQIIGDATRQRR